MTVTFLLSFVISLGFRCVLGAVFLRARGSDTIFPENSKVGCAFSHQVTVENLRSGSTVLVFNMHFPYDRSFCHLLRDFLNVSHCDLK